ncbi:tetratricopeptide repeat-containing sensor histidine kinase [Flagellimonas allohymeniacidonis]|uniref:histidine kinase n=1 Tax=Flagellimonas allohymeniacidonis TaxID=2517819 RepID=A0A4Q8QK71_9FLAO|nr:ATP-binding protein [Allomuricauda hymeniacidonis]TAI48636.1 tetratricopeptide repeat protein [Allomuricauda hymeniacidonis]
MPQITKTNHLQLLLRRVLVLGMMVLFTLPTISQKSKRDSIAYRLKRLESTNRFNVKDTTHIDLLANLAREYRFINNDSLYNISKKVLELSREIGYSLGEIKALEGLGNYYSDQGDQNKSLSYFKKALRIAKKVGATKCELSIINGLGHDYAYMGNYAEALNIYLQGIDLAKQTENKHMLSILNENIAALYADQKDFKNALIFYDKVQTINQEIGNDIIKAETHSNMASLYKDAKNYELAMFNINNSINTFEKHKVYDWLAYAYEVKGSIYLEQKKYQWALYWYDQSSMLHTHQLDDDREKIQLMNGMANVYLGLDRDSLSMVFANEGFRLSKKIKSLQGLIDCSETLYKLHKKGNKSEAALSYLETFKKLSDSLSKDKNRQSLALLETKLEYQQEKQELIAANETALAKQRNYIYFSILAVLILCTVIFIIRRSENIQKKLNRELKEKSKVVSERETQLNEINRTKTKLLSIIGHDLRGPIGGLQGILKLFTQGEISKTEFLSFIPKLRNDVENISFALNNLLSWGQTQLNGVVTKPKRIYMEKLVTGNIQLLSEVAAGKSIKIINQLPESVPIWADQNQIDIVVRNILSNAIKFTPEDGLITIEAQEKDRSWQIMIRDTGIGMNKEIQKKIFAESNNITTYGTNNERGTGLGLSLCKEMILKNRGQIWVESTLRKGSSFYFTLPKAEKKYQQAS